MLSESCADAKGEMYEIVRKIKTPASIASPEFSWDNSVCRGSYTCNQVLPGLLVKLFQLPCARFELVPSDESIRFAVLLHFSDLTKAETIGRLASARIVYTGIANDPRVCA